MLSHLLSSVLLPNLDLQFTQISGMKSDCWRLSAFHCYHCCFGGGKGFQSDVQLQFENGINT